MKKFLPLLLSVLLLTGVVAFAAPTPIYKEGVREERITFTFSEFNKAFTDGTLGKVRFSLLPESYQGQLRLKGKPVKELQEISANDIKKLTFIPAEDFIGSVVFMWNGAVVGSGFSDSASTVTIFISNKTTVSRIPSKKPPSFVGEGMVQFRALIKKIQNSAKDKNRTYAPTPTLPPVEENKK